MGKTTLTHARLLEVLHYDSATGVFTWRVSEWGGKAQHTGKRAGAPHSGGYRQIAIDGRTYLEHRLAWFYMCGCWPVAEIDHINRNRDDNRFENLREASRLENANNRGLAKNNTSGVNGVRIREPDHRYRNLRYEVTISGRYVGTFTSMDAAIAAKDRADP